MLSMCWQGVRTLEKWIVTVTPNSRSQSLSGRKAGRRFDRRKPERSISFGAYPPWRSDSVTQVFQPLDECKGDFSLIKNFCWLLKLTEKALRGVLLTLRELWEHTERHIAGQRAAGRGDGEVAASPAFRNRGLDERVGDDGEIRRSSV
jgi:hypothetical protein